MDAQIWVYVEQIAIIVASLAGGGGVVWLVNRLKDTLNLSGTPALVLSAVVAVVVALAGQIAEGVIAPGTVRPDNLAELFLLVFVQSQVIYRMLRDRAEAAAAS